MKTVREWLGLSLSEAGRDLARIAERKTGAYTRQWLSKCERTNFTPEDLRVAYGVLIANRLTEIFGQRVGVTIEVNSPWHVTPWLFCSCGRPFEARGNQKRCEKCIMKNRS